MEITEYIHEGDVGTSYKKYTRSYAIHAGHTRKIRGESNPSKTYYEMSKISVNIKQKYVDNMRY